MKQNSKIIFIICTLMISGLLMLNYFSDDSTTFLASDCVTSNHNEIIGEDDTVTIDESSNYEGAFLYSKVYNLKKGNYTLNVAYQSDTNNSVIINTNLGQIANQKLPATASLTTTDINFQLPQDCDTVQFICIYYNSGSVTIHNMTLSGEKPFYTDALFFGLLTMICGIILYLYCNKRNKYSIKNQAEIIGVILFATIVLSSYPLFTDYLIGGHDLNYHLSRIEGIKDGLLGGQFPVDIYPQTNYGYGYLGALYPSLFLYFPAVLRILGVSMAMSYKVFLFTINIATVSVCYYSLRKMTCSKYAAAFASIVYCLMPYRLNNLYIRSAVGETLALIFIPLIICGIYQICLGNKKQWYILAFAFTGLIHSHILSVLICAGLCGIFVVLYFGKILREKRWLDLLKAALATILMNLWYLVSFMYYFKGNFNSAAFSIDFSKQTIFPQQLFQTLVTVGFAKTSAYGAHDEMPQTLGLFGFLSLVIILLFLIYDKEKKDKLFRFSTALFGLTILFIFSITTLFPWEVFQKIGIIKKIVEMIQFPWRLLGFIGAFLAVLTGIFLDRKNQLMKFKLVIFSGLTIFLLFGSVILMDTYANQEMSFTKISGGYTHTAPEDYLPAGTTKDVFNTTTPIVSSESAISIESFTKRNTTVQLTYTCNIEDGYIDLPLMYYKGYKADSNETSLEIVKSPENRVRVLLNKTDSASTLTVSREINILIIFVILLSLASTVGVIYYGLTLRKIEKREMEKL